MSFDYYVNKWIITKKNLENLTQKDDVWRQKAKPVNDRIMANLLFGDFYARYCMLYQDLDNCIDQMVQPQKRITVKKIVDAAAVRLMEFNAILRELDLSEYHYIDGTLVELKLVPYDVEILHPALFHHRPIDVEDMWKKIQRGEKIFAPPPVEKEKEEEGDLAVTKSILKAFQSEEAFERQETDGPKKKKRERKKVVVEEQPTLSTEETNEIKRIQLRTENILLIQTAERARQGRMYFFVKNMFYNQTQQLKEKQTKNQVKPEDPQEPVTDQAKVEMEASTKIQSAWRGFASRKRDKFSESQRRFLIGMYEPVYRSLEYKETFEANLEKRREYRDQRIREYIQAIDSEQARILRVVAPGLMEDIGDEIREWFRVWYKEVKQFDQIPPEDKGGTILVVRGETMTPKEFLDEVERKRREKVKAGGEKAKKEKERREREKLKKAEKEKKKKELEQKKKIAKAKAAKKKKRKPGEYEYDFEEPVADPLYKEGMEEHLNIWDLRNDFENPLEKHYTDIITEKQYLENQLECRRIVDNMMRVELDILNDALDEDRVRYGLKRIKRKKQKKGKKKKGKRGKRGKKDLTGNVPVEQLFQELVDNQIIQTYPKVSLEDFHGDFNYNNWDLRNLDFDPPAGLLDVRQAVVLNCILPLGVEVMKRPRSVLILGPEKSGKHLLANAIFNATRCVLFDLSPETLSGRYEGASGMRMLLHLVDKMSKLLAPSIIYFREAEKPFYKKVPKKDKELNPKRIGSKIKSIIKGIKPADRVLVLGLTNQPWAAQGKLRKIFERHILVPRTGYNSVYMYWRELLMRYPGVDRNFNVTALAKVTKDYPLPVLREVLEYILVPRRIIQLHFKPLTCEEIYEYFIQNDITPITDKMWRKYQKWYNRTNLGKQQTKFNKWAKAKRDALERKKK
ncbi:dynein regulatory complex protein 11-like [Diabrotica virgifera virgifera]|uniref:ATPase AAA-type core domain-containing protein n=1 Tax=Diabrotica virgifera virgifera TaxID=50390 RepID=A0ABM5I972_DIAVI|nr:dynein regulatory complex protein 11-like [Diabrotica virgifera virgifera]